MKKLPKFILVLVLVAVVMLPIKYGSQPNETLAAAHIIPANEATEPVSFVPRGQVPFSKSISSEVNGLPSRVQSARGTNSGNGVLLTVTLGSAPVNGNSLVLTYGSYGGPTLVSNISEAGATWTLQKAKQFGTVDNEIWLASYVSGASTTITINLSGAPSNAVANVCEYSGLSNFSPLDQTATNSGNSQNADTGRSATTTQASELWVGSTTVGGGSDASNDQTSPTNGFTLIDGALQGSQSSGVSNAYLERIVSATGAAESGTTFGLNSNLPWAGCIATFKVATTTSTTTSSSQRSKVNGLPSRVQSSTASAVFSVVYTITLGSTPANGDAIFIVATTSDSNHIVNINQTGATWAQVTYAGLLQATELWAAFNVQNAGTTITVGLTGTALSAAIAVEYSGILSSDATDKTASNSGSGTPGDTGTTATTTQANELWIGGIGAVPANGQSSPTRNFSQVATSLVISTESSSVVLVAGFYEKIVSATGTANTGCTLSYSAAYQPAWQGVIATFKAAATASGSSSTSTGTQTMSSSSSTSTVTQTMSSSSSTSTVTQSASQTLAIISSQLAIVILVIAAVALVIGYAHSRREKAPKQQ